MVTMQWLYTYLTCSSFLSAEPKTIYLSTSLPVKSLGKTDRRLLMSCSTWSAFAAVCLGTGGDSVTSCCLAYRELASQNIRTGNCQQIQEHKQQC